MASPLTARARATRDTAHARAAALLAAVTVLAGCAGAAPGAAGAGPGDAPDVPAGIGADGGSPWDPRAGDGASGGDGTGGASLDGAGSRSADGAAGGDPADGSPCVGAPCDASPPTWDASPSPGDASPSPGDASPSDGGPVPATDASPCVGDGCAPCVPDCVERLCGDDGCGGTCGSCPQGQGCADGLCVSKCVPDCVAKACGDDGCGGLCGSCAQGLGCSDGQCIPKCAPDCGAKSCGDDGCGGSCGACGAGLSCVAGSCQAGPCTPSCGGNACGDDGCGGSCGTCAGGWSCAAGACQPPSCVPSCGGASCGDDGCGGSCGGCPAGHACQGGACVCVPSCGGPCASDGCGGTCSPCPPPPNDDPAKILVYTNNIENMGTPSAQGDSCPADWQDLLWYLRKQAHRPDFLLVQQITDEPQLDSLAGQMEAMLGGDYGTIIAQKDPAPWSAANCDYKLKQTKGIIYRKERFTYIQGSKTTWWSVKVSGADCVVADAARYLNVASQFTDKVSGHSLAVASVHWPVIDGCGVTNAKLVHQALKAYTGVQMFLWGGDMNLPDLKELSPASAYYTWYERTNVELSDPDTLGYRDAVWHHCNVTAGAAGLKQCLIDNGTLSTVGADPRIDFLFFKYANDWKPGDIKNPPPADGVHTVGFNEAGAAQDPDDTPLGYSDHRAVRAYVYW